MCCFVFAIFCKKFKRTDQFDFYFVGKLLWQGAECWNECLKLLSIAEAAIPQNFNGFIVRRRFFSHCITPLFCFFVDLVTLLSTCVCVHTSDLSVIVYDIYELVD